MSDRVSDGQRAPCWLVTTRNGRRAFVANAGSGTISSYLIDSRGTLTLRDPTAGVVPGGKPLDMALSAGDGFLFVIDASHAAVLSFAVGDDGGLTSLGETTGLPSHAVGIAAR